MHAGTRFRLVVRRGPQPNQKYDLSRDTITIGRDITNDIVINDPEVSRHHARLVRTATGYAIEDLRSTNGTFVNRQRIQTTQPLSNGDLIGLGEIVILVYEAVSVGEEQTMAASGQKQAPAYRQPEPEAPSYDYDYEEDETELERNRWIVIGCAGLTLLLCCVLVASAIVIDQMNLYCELPLLKTMFVCP